MNSEVRIAKSFRRDAKPLEKKYPSFPDDLNKLVAELLENPTLGVDIGHNAYKTRLAIRSKGKGKSGGARVISWVDKEIIAIVDDEEELVIVYLLTVYDKSDTETISETKLLELIADLEL